MGFFSPSKLVGWRIWRAGEACGGRRQEGGGKRGENFVRDENYYSRVRSRNTCLYVCLYYELVEYVMYPLCYSRVVRIVEYVVYPGANCYA